MISSKLLLALATWVGILLPVVQSDAFDEDDEKRSAMQVYGHEEEDDEEPDTYTGPQGDEPLLDTHLKSLHLVIDTNQDGRITRAEAFAYDKLCKTRMASKDTKRYMKEHDKSKDGKLSLEEFIDQFTPQDPDLQVDPNYLNVKVQKKKEFEIADVNKDGMLDKKEVAPILNPQIMPALVTVHTEVEMKEKDTNGDRKLDTWEYFSGGWPKADGTFEILPHQKELFQQLDKDKDGFLNFAEVQYAVEGLHHTEELVDHLFEAADHNGDTHILDEELTKAFERIDNGNHKWDFRQWHRHHIHEEL